jgi:uncharacterized protein YndB with AHSA1/START domain
MIVLEDEVVVDRPRQQVFDNLTDLRRYPEWQPAITSAEWTSSSGLAAGLGFRFVIHGAGRRFEIDGELTEVDPPRHLALRSTRGPARVEATCDFEPADDGRATRIRFHVDVQPTGLLRLAEGVIAERVHRGLPKALEELRAHLEERLPA